MGNVITTGTFGAAAVLCLQDNALVCHARMHITSATYRSSAMTTTGQGGSAITKYPCRPFVCNRNSLSSPDGCKVVPKNRLHYGHMQW
jgi:hypothetical protein